MPLKKHRSPQEKKALSYQKDRRNCYGAHDKGSRKSIPLRKRLINRKARRMNKESLVRIVDPAEIIMHQPLPAHWKKAPDRPLLEHVNAKVLARKNAHGARIRRRIKFYSD